MRGSWVGLAISVLMLAGCSTSGGTPDDKSAATSTSAPSPSPRASASVGPTQDDAPPGVEEEGLINILEAVEKLPGVDGVYLDSRQRPTAIVHHNAARKRVVAAGARAVPAHPGEKALVRLQDSIASMPRARTELMESGVRLTGQTLGVGVRDPKSAWAQQLARMQYVTVYRGEGGRPD